MKTTNKTKERLINLSLNLFDYVKPIVHHVIEKNEESSLWLVKSWEKTYNIKAI